MNCTELGVVPRRSNHRAMAHGARAFRASRGHSFLVEGDAQHGLVVRGTEGSVNVAHRNVSSCGYFTVPSLSRSTSAQISAPGILHARMRKGSANTARGIKRFVEELVAQQRPTPGQAARSSCVSIRDIGRIRPSSGSFAWGSRSPWPCERAKPWTRPSQPSTILPVCLGLEPLINATLRFSERVGGASPGRKVLTLVHAMAAGGSHIDQANVLRLGSTSSVLPHRVMVPSTLGTFPRAFAIGHLSQLDAVLAEVLRRAWALGAGPGSDQLVIDLDSTTARCAARPRAGPAMATPRNSATALSWPPAPTPARCSMLVCARARPILSA